MPEVEHAARFDRIRYAQAWEDADVLCAAMAPKPGVTLFSICASGDNALALLTLDPARVVAVDLSEAQLSCLRLRIAALRRLDDDAFLELLGAAPSTRRAALFDAAAGGLEGADRTLWRGLRSEAIERGIAGVGRFESYFRLFRRRILPLVHGRRVVDDVFTPRDSHGRRRFHDEIWNSWRWRLLLRTFFSNAVMGRLGRDPAFFRHVGGSLAEHVARRVRHATVDLDPSSNPYMSTILRGRPGETLPLPWRRESLDPIRARLDRIETVRGDISSAAEGGRYEGFYLSDVFEYMSEPEAEAAYGDLLAAAAPGARLVYWNMMVPRSRPAAFAARVRRLDALSDTLGAADKAFFYSGFHVDEVL